MVNSVLPNPSPRNVGKVPWEPNRGRIPHQCDISGDKKEARGPGPVDLEAQCRRSLSYRDILSMKDHNHNQEDYSVSNTRMNWVKKGTQEQR